MRTRFAIVVMGLCVALPARAAEDLSWIGSLPGVSAAVQKRSGSTEKGVFTLSGDTEQVFATIEQGLTDRGWKVKKIAGVVALAAVVKSIKATKGDARVKIVATGAAGSTTLSVKVESGSVTTVAGPSESAGPATAQPAPAPPRAARQDAIVILDNDRKETIACEGRAVVVNGNDNKLSLQGPCASLQLNGNDNQVAVRGRIDEIGAMGNDNQATWSKADNPAPPRVGSLGSKNVIRGE